MGGRNLNGGDELPMIGYKVVPQFEFTRPVGEHKSQNYGL